MEVDGRLEMLNVPEAARHPLDLLYLAVESLAHHVGNRKLVIDQDVIDVSANRFCRLTNRLQPAVCRPEVPPLPEFPA